jgi:hypothetical protein
VEHLSAALSLLQQDKWQVNLTKCAFAQQRIAYLGHVISSEGLSTDSSKIQSIRDWPVPVSIKELHGFLGLSGYYGKFIKHYTLISQPLTSLLKKGAIFIWTDVTDTAFRTLKEALSSASVLVLPDFTQQFVVETDACDSGIGAILSQNGHSLALVSRALGPHHHGLSVYEKEYLVILLAIQQWRSYLQIGEFITRTDHKSLTHLTDQCLHTEYNRKRSPK